MTCRRYKMYTGGKDLANLIADIVFALIGIDAAPPCRLLAKWTITLRTPPCHPDICYCYFRQ